MRSPGLLIGVWFILPFSGAAAWSAEALRAEAMRHLKLSRCTVQTLALPALTNAAGARMPCEVMVDLDGTNQTLCLQAHSLRTLNFKLLVQRNGGLTEETPSPPATWRGHVRGRSGSMVTAAIHDGEMTAMIHLPEEPPWVVESLRQSLPHSPKGTHAIFRTDAALPVDGRCAGSKPALQPAAFAMDANTPPPAPNALPLHILAPGAAAPVNYHYAKIAFDSEVEYYRGTIEGTMNAIEALLNSVDAIYTRDVQISYLLTAIIVRTAEPDPYGSDNAETLLEQFRTHWNDNHSNIERDVAHLLTGRDLDGSTIGIAHLGTICARPKYSYGLSGNQFGLPTFDRQVGAMAHELGHNWNACHCDEPDCMPPSQGDCDIMRSGIPLNPDLYFGTASKAQIINWRDRQTSCLDSGLIFVDWQATPPYWGTALHPFCTLADGMNATPDGGQMFIRGVARYFENLTISRRMTLRANGGQVVIGN